MDERMDDAGWMAEDLEQDLDEGESMPVVPTPVDEEPPPIAPPPPVDEEQTPVAPPPAPSRAELYRAFVPATMSRDRVAALSYDAAVRHRQLSGYGNNQHHIARYRFDAHDGEHHAAEYEQQHRPETKNLVPVGCGRFLDLANALEFQYAPPILETPPRLAARFPISARHGANSGRLPP